MTYYTSYTSRWSVSFVDLKGNTWVVYIQDPTYSGSVTPLQGSEVPFEWFGQGDEDQTKVISGSTGTIRVIVTESNKSDFVIGGIFPNEINDRRVLAYCGGTLVWQGFVQQESYSQQMYDAPYEMEIPVSSPLALADKWPLPDYDSTIASYRYTYRALQFAIGSFGCLFSNLVTNVCDYVDIYGNKSSNEWIASELDMAVFYDWSDGKYATKTVGNLLEILLQPYASVSEIGSNIFVMKREASNGSLYYLDLSSGFYLNVEKDTQLHDTMALSSLSMCGTDNKKTIIPAPSSVSYSRSVEYVEDVIKLDSSMIDATTLPSKIQHKQGTNHNVALNVLYPIGSTDTSAYTLFTHGAATYPDEMLARTLKITHTDINNTTSAVCEVGFAVDGQTSVIIQPKMFLRTKYDVNRLKLSIKPHNIDDIIDGEQDTTTDSEMTVQVTTGSKYLTESGSWSDSACTFEVRKMTDGELYFSLPYDEPKQITITLQDKAEVVYCHTNVEVSLSYVYYILASSFRFLDFESAIMKGVYGSEKVVNVGGYGDSVDAQFKTRAGEDTCSYGGSLSIYGGFYDKYGEMDEGNREMIEIDAARLPDTKSMEMMTMYCYITDGSTTYLPMAVGMNARDFTYKLRLVSTNK